jgi:hypothetical protein
MASEILRDDAERNRAAAVDHKPEQYDPEQYDPEEYDPEEYDPDADRNTPADTDDSATAFVTKGKARLEPILDGIKATALRAGGVQGMALMAVHGSLMAYTSTLLNYMAGIGEEEDLPEPRDEMADSKPNNPVEQAQLAAHLNPDVAVPAAKEGAGVTSSPLVEVTAPQSQPVPSVKLQTSATPQPVALPSVGQSVDTAVAAPNPAPSQGPPEQIAVVPQPLVSSPAEQAALLS